jgi:hypothetical protein
MDMVAAIYFSAKEVSLNSRVTKQINLPADPWNLTNLVLDVV